jgi:long-chain acyl-CoA synthetase
VNIAEEIFQRANPNAIAVIDADISHTYGDLERLSRSVAKTLRVKVGANKKALIGLKGKDGLDYIALSLGILRSGSCFVPIATELSPSECEALISTLSLDAVISFSEEGEGPLNFSYSSFENNPHVESSGWREELEKLNPALIRFSSGTTGASKGILLSHETLRQRVEAANTGLQIVQEDRVLWVLSMAHHFAVSIILYLWNGASIVIPSSHLAEDFLSAANKHGVSVLYAAPFHFVLLAAAPDLPKWPSLRMAVSTTAALPQEAAEDFAAAFGVYPAQALGVMEVGLPFLNHPDPKTHSSSIGRAQAGFEVELRDNEGTKVDAGSLGELFIRGPGMFDAYMAPWKPSADIFSAGGWFSTGDIAIADDEGYYYLQGRTHTVINVGGMKFFPEEVEKLLCSQPGITDARVMGRDHPTYGCVPVAEVIGSGDPKVSPLQLSMLCRKNLARYKIPVEIRFVESIPKTVSGKIIRR